jgi:hypothetical protein
MSDSFNDNPTESSREDARLLVESTTTPSDPAMKSYKGPKSVYQWSIILCAVVFFFAELFELSLFGPITALLERSICRDYYVTTTPSVIGDNGWVTENLCKEKAIQEELALVKGYKAVFDCIPGPEVPQLLRVDLTGNSLHSRSPHGTIRSCVRSH